MDTDEIGIDDRPLGRPEAWRCGTTINACLSSKLNSVKVLLKSAYMVTKLEPQ